MQQYSVFGAVCVGFVGPGNAADWGRGAEAGPERAGGLLLSGEDAVIVGEDMTVDLLVSKAKGFSSSSNPSIDFVLSCGSTLDQTISLTRQSKLFAFNAPLRLKDGRINQVQVVMRGLVKVRQRKWQP